MDISDYHTEATELVHSLPVNQKTLFIAIRRFKAHQRNSYNDHIAAFLAENGSRPAIISLMEPRDVDPEGYALLLRWQEKYPHLVVADFSYNPIALYLWFKAHHHQLALVAPQFHLIIIAQMAGVAFLPIAYDNKVHELLAQGGHESIPINKLDSGALQRFADNFYESSR
jgi:hypothetical protein